MNNLALFTDASLNPLLKCGVGGYLVVPASFLKVSPDSLERSAITERLVLRRFSGTSSSRLEVQTVLWALENYQDQIKASFPGKLRVYTDSQCVAGLLKRRTGLTANSFLSKKTNRPLMNAPLYLRFYELSDELNFEIVKVAGHSRSYSHDTVHRVFSFIDREVRKALTLWVGEFKAGIIQPMP